MLNENPNLMENAIRGAEHQRELLVDAAKAKDFDLGWEHEKAAELLEDFSKDYIPCLPEEL